ncbi:HlyD family type I secretion periplasmic adaptor subunit [Magnetospira sp. QH-2]|uniref:HlyD family type I secretion periplasmic adaptor subunit n=1 Tax=Magnetospira sp. (strain QH-2) TaxID=1288970 RepID=UPI0005FA3471|nr:HlyD family type I secretion periplasmic adaptor subunit [Magnetospira sp. QH-2]
MARWQRFGWFVALGFLGGGLVWSATARLDSAAVAPGVVGVESNRKTVAHLEGGIVSEIKVRDGETVTAGQMLLQLDDTQARATLDLLEKRRMSLRAEQERLRAERDGAEAINFPDDLLDKADKPEFAEILVGQIDLFQSRLERMAGQQKVITERIAKLGKEVVGYKAQAAAHQERLALLREEQIVLDKLGKKGLVPKTQLLEIKRRIAEAKGHVGDYAARIARSEEAVAELRAQAAQPREQQRAQVAEQWQKVRVRLNELEEKIHAASDILARTGVRAPMAGRVVDLRVHTPGGIVQPGEPLLDLVPNADRLMVDLRIDPKDIDVVRVGMAAQLRMTAFNARATQPLEGTLVSVSADRMVDPVSGRAYFAGRVQPALQQKGFDMARLGSGMQAEVLLVTGERTVLDYLTEPVFRSLHRAGREH